MKAKIILSIACLLALSSVQANTLKDYLVSGNTLWSKGQLSKAEIQFKKALETAPESSVVHERLANLYLTQNKTSEAITQFQEAITHDPENANLFIGIAIAYLHKQYYQMANAMVNQALQIDPEMKNAHKLRQYIDAKQSVIESANANIQGHEELHQPVTGEKPATIEKKLNGH